MKKIIVITLLVIIGIALYRVYNSQGYQAQKINKIQVERCVQDMQINPSLVCD